MARPYPDTTRARRRINGSEISAGVELSAYLVLSSPKRRPVCSTFVVARVAPRTVQLQRRGLPASPWIKNDSFEYACRLTQTTVAPDTRDLPPYSGESCMQTVRSPMLISTTTAPNLT